MTDGSLAVQDRGGTDLEEELSSANAYWADARRDATADRYLRPHAEAHESLRIRLASLQAASDQAKVAAGDVNIAVAAADAERLESQSEMTQARSQMAESEAATRAALTAVEAAAAVHADAIQLAKEANTTAP